jgi:predicted permease
VDWEIQHYLVELTDRLVEEGWEEAEARAEARRRFGSRYQGRMTRLERSRRWRMGMGTAWEALASGVRDTVRSVRRGPGMALGIIMTLALGIGANAAIFQVVDRLLLRPPLHVEEPDRVVRLVFNQGDRWSQVTMTYPDVEAIGQASAFESVAKVAHAREFILGSDGEVAPAQGQLASASFFSTLGVSLHRGRFYGPEEDVVGAGLTAVLSHGFWERAFGADPDVVGRTIRIDGQPTTVLGITPEGFTGAGLGAVDMWLPMDPWNALLTGGEEWRESRGWWWLTGIARLADGVGREAAEEEATAILRNGRAEMAESGEATASQYISAASLVAGTDGGPTAESRVALWLLGVSLAVLMIACANVANLLLARGARTKAETAIRLALGVSRSRLMGQVILQTTVLALVGGGVALLTASWTRQLIQRTVLPEVHFPDVGTEIRVLAFAVGVSLMAGVLAGVGPAVQGLRSNVSEDLKVGRRSVTGRSRVGRALSVFQTAVAVVLLVGAGLFVRSLGEVRAVDMGVDVDLLALVHLDPEGTVDLNADMSALYDAGLERSSSLPEVESAVLTTSPLFWSFSQQVRVPGLDSLPRLPGGGPYWSGVSPGYFETVGLAIERGRGFLDTDGVGGTPVAVVSRLMADSIWGGEAALGQCILVGSDDNPPCTMVVGIAEEASRGGLEEEPFFAYYLPLAQTEASPRGIYLRSQDPAAVAGPAAALLRESPDVRWATVTPLREAMDPQARAWRMGATMFTVLGVLALVVASIGLYSLLSFQVAQRTREIGIRAALGAERGKILGNVVLEGAGLAALGVFGGLSVAFLMSPLLRDLLFRVSPRDPWVLGAVAGVLLAVALLASTLPGLKATRVQPTEALRSE